MSPTLKPGETVFTSPLPYWFKQPNTEDLIACVDPRDKRVLIKRIEKIVKGKYFVRGDNLNASTDSRVFGMIERQDIIGKVFYIISKS